MRKTKSEDRFTNVAYCEPPRFSNRKGPVNSAKTKGKSYELRVYKYLADKYGGYLVRHNQWIQYQERKSKRVKYCQLDVDILIDDFKMGIIVEVKLSYRSAARTKLRSLYLPLMKKLHPEIEIWHTVQVCRSLTPPASKEKRILHSFADVEKSHETLVLTV